MKDKKIRSICLPKELDARLVTLAKENDRSVSYVAYRLIEKALDNVEQLNIESRPAKKGRDK